MFLVTLLFIPMGVFIVQQVIQRAAFSDKTTADIRLVRAAPAVFPTTSSNPDSFEVIQIFEYELSSSDYLSDITLTATFLRTTRITRVQAWYSVDLEGFSESYPFQNQVVLTLSHPIDTTKKSIIYIMTSRNTFDRSLVTNEVPDIHISGRDKDGKAVYR